MCAINGLIYFATDGVVDKCTLQRMCEQSAHRGPDDRGFYLNGNVGFAFNRLSIIDLAGGSQPMANASETAWIVFNGEIYNYRELREKLIGAGHRFRTMSDTETILAAWDQYGEDCVDHLRGMFAFAIWDDRRKLLFAARDRLGIKPFYYHQSEHGFAFASEAKSLLQVSWVKPDIDSGSIADYLRHGYVTAPHSLFRDIHKLPPAHTLKLERGRVTVRKYWDVPMQPPRNLNENEALEEFGRLFEETLRLHMISDRPVGVLLSGGIDSSSIVAELSRLGVSHLKTFSVGYDSRQSELGFARLVAERFGTTHYEVQVTPQTFQDCFEEMVWHMDEPVADAPSVSLLCLSKLAGQEVTVALSGEGADEILGGYTIYRRMLLFDQLNRLPFSRWAGRAFERLAPAGKLRKNGSMLGRSLEDRYRVDVVFPLEEVARLLPDNTDIDDPRRTLSEVHSRSSHLCSLRRMSYVDMSTWLPDYLLLKADRMSMAHSLELRVPFLDHRLVEFTSLLPPGLKINTGRTKYLLKRSMQSLLPPSILRRPKRGFPIPTKQWFRKELKTYIREKLLASDSPCLSFFPREEVARVLENHDHRDCRDQIHALLVFDSWYRTFIRGTRAVAATILAFLPYCAECVAH